MTNKNIKNGIFPNSGVNEPLSAFTGDENFCLEYAESLAEGDLRPIVIKDYVEEKE